jgi:small subunit ribosomal protein S1
MVTGRFADDASTNARVELGEGIFGMCKTTAAAVAPAKVEPMKETKADLSSLTSMLQARWKTGGEVVSKKEPARAGQVRSFRIAKLDRGAKKIEVELA